MLQDIRENIKAAVEQSRTDVIRSVLETCNVQTKDAEGVATLKDKILNYPVLEEGTYLHLASKLNHGDVVRTLLACGSNPAVLNKEGHSAVEIASSHSKNVQQIYVEELLRAAANSECDRVQQLLAAGVTVNSVDSEESCNTALHWAACFGNRDIVACLLARGADVNATNTCGASPLHDAVVRNAPDIVEELLNGGADPNIKAFRGKFAGKTPALLAVDFPAVDKLIRLKEETMVNSSSRGDRIPSPRAERTRSVSLEVYDRPCNNGYLASTSLPHGDYEHRLLYSSRASLDLTPRIDQMVESLVRTHIGTPVAPLVTQGPLHLLWPPPRSIIELDEAEPFVPNEELQISVLQGSVCVHSILDVWDINRHSLSTLGYNVRIGDIQPVPGCESDSQVECCVNPDLFSEHDAYQIHITTNKMHVSAASLAGLQYALRTLIQLLRLSVAAAKSEGRVPSLPLVLIQDHPTLRHRAVLLDVTPNGRVPAIEYLLHLIELWASLKISHLHLYTRLLPSREWQLSYTKSEMVTIHRYCQDRFISLVPVLDVEPHVTRPIVDLMWPAFQEILASFPNTRYVHVGPRLSSLIISSEEEGRLDPDASTNGGDGDSVASEVSVVTTTSQSSSAGFVRDLWHRLGLSSNVTMMLCANGLHTGSHNIPPNVVLVEYGFQADYDFVQWTNDFHRQGNVTCVCPGTASWNSLAGCPEASVLNIYRAVQAATKQGSLGVIIAHWSGSYHLTPHPFSWPGFVVGAGLTWSATSHWDYLHTWLPALLDAHIFLDSACILGNVVLELGYAETLVLRIARGQERSDPRDLPPQDGSVLYKLLTDPDNVNLEKIPPDLFMRVAKHIKRCQVNLLSAKARCAFSEMVVQELQLAADLLLTACRIGRSLVTVGTNPNSNMGLSVVNLGVSNLPPTFRTDIANKLLAHIEQYKGTWLQRHLPSGLQSSLVVLNSALRRFVPEDSRSDSGAAVGGLAAYQWAAVIEGFTSILRFILENPLLTTMVVTLVTRITEFLASQNQPTRNLQAMANEQPALLTRRGPQNQPMRNLQAMANEQPALLTRRGPQNQPMRNQLAVANEEPAILPVFLELCYQIGELWQDFQRL